MDSEERQRNLILGQYLAGRIGDQPVPGYREEPGVDPSSLTPTYAHLTLFLDSWRWQGVPFLLTSGKRLTHKVTEIVIQFKRVPHMMFRPLLDTAISANQLVMGIYPEEKITLTFQTKNPGARMCLRPVTMDFQYHQNETGNRWDAYEKVLLDCIAGDQMLFWRQDAVEQTWSFFEPLLASCETCSDRAQRLNFYPAGSWGPAMAEVNDVGVDPPMDRG
jgi:glucose-6-phosphate 1-dehydrogenase